MGELATGKIAFSESKGVSKMVYFELDFLLVYWKGIIIFD